MALSAEVKAAICAKLADGRSLRSAVLDEGMPPRWKVFEELDADPEFADQYARAKQAGLESIADDIMAISDETEVADVCDAEGNVVDVKLDATAVARNRLRVDSRKWLLAKLAPKKYGDRTEHNHTGELSVTLGPTEAKL